MCEHNPSYLRKQWVELGRWLANPSVARRIHRLHARIPAGPAVPAAPPERSQARPWKLHHRLTTDAIGQLVADYRQGIRVDDLVDRYKISKTSVLTLLHQQGVPRRFCRRLSDTDVQEAAKLYAAGWSLRRIGQHFGVDDETIRYRLKRQGIRMRESHGRDGSPPPAAGASRRPT